MSFWIHCHMCDEHTEIEHTGSQEFCPCSSIDWTSCESMTPGKCAECEQILVDTYGATSRYQGKMFTRYYLDEHFDVTVKPGTLMKITSRGTVLAATASQAQCVCPIVELLQNGCKCGAMERERGGGEADKPGRDKSVIRRDNGDPLAGAWGAWLTKAEALAKWPNAQEFEQRWALGGIYPIPRDRVNASFYKDKGFKGATDECLGWRAKGAK